MEKYLLIMGVSGSGKTAVAKSLAQKLNYYFYDADDFHPKANIAKMAAGEALNDDDRQPWLESLRDLLKRNIDLSKPTVLACSALKKPYRDLLRQAGDIQFIYLQGDFETIYSRMQKRLHFMKAEMLESQFNDLEEPVDAIKIDISQDLDSVVLASLNALSQASDKKQNWSLSKKRFLGSETKQRDLAFEIYNHIKDLPIVSPHGHVPAEWLSDKDFRFASPAELLIIPDHYILRMLHSQGIPLANLGVKTTDGSWFETEHRKIWKSFAENFHLFRATPTGIWLKDELINVFDIDLKLNSGNADAIYDLLQEKIQSLEYSPRALFKKFNIEYLATTDAATDSLEHHKKLRRDGFENIIPTFRPDNVINLDTENWQENIISLSELSAIDVIDYDSFILALKNRREYFISLGATASDHGAETAYTETLSTNDLAGVWARAQSNKSTKEDARRFTAHMLIEMAKMSLEDGLVMQLHVGSYRNHDQASFLKYGRDIGADIPIKAEWSKNLRALLNKFGNEAKFSMIVFTLDETSYSRELAPLAGYYPALKIGPPWWFFDSAKGMERYLNSIVETAGFYNLAGFNDDTRAFASIPARHDVWRRIVSKFIATNTLDGFIDYGDSLELAYDLAYKQAKQSYNLR